jgi:hypothetical protein
MPALGWLNEGIILSLNLSWEGGVSEEYSFILMDWLDINRVRSV